MNPTETNLETPPDVSVKALQEEVQSLRAIITGMLLVLIVLSGALNIFLMRQASGARQQFEQAQQFVNESVPFGLVLRDFWPKVVDFSKTHPDFDPIVKKYSQYMQPASPASAPKK